jgi:hypothetical protein
MPTLSYYPGQVIPFPTAFRDADDNTLTAVVSDATLVIASGGPISLTVNGTTMIIVVPLDQAFGETTFTLSWTQVIDDVTSTLSITFPVTIIPAVIVVTGGNPNAGDGAWLQAMFAQDVIDWGEPITVGGVSCYALVNPLQKSRSGEFEPDGYGLNARQPNETRFVVAGSAFVTPPLEGALITRLTTGDVFIATKCPPTIVNQTVVNYDIVAYRQPQEGQPQYPDAQTEMWQ